MSKNSLNMANNNFDVKKWADKNNELVEKSFERWKEDNLEKDKPEEVSKEPNTKKSEDDS